MNNTASPYRSFQSALIQEELMPDFFYYYFSGKLPANDSITKELIMYTYIISVVRKVLLFVVIVAFASQLHAQNGEKFTPLFDGTSLDGWVIENSEDDNFYVQNNLLRVEEPGGWLRSEHQFSDFFLRADFRFLTENADSGIFVRAVADVPFFRGWPGNSYQVQTRDISVNRSNNPLWLADIYRHNVSEDGDTHFDREAVLEAYSGVGEWQTFEIEAIGDSLTVWLNGIFVTKAENIVNPAGYIGLQGETGIVEFRAIEIREL